MECNSEKCLFSLDSFKGDGLAETTGLIYEVWKRTDTLLVVLGSSICLRNIYFKAREVNKLGQYLGYQASKEDYIFGTDFSQNTDLIEKICTKNKPIIIFYLSCLDIITSSNLLPLVKILNDRGYKTLLLERGPLVKAYKSPAKKLKTFLDKCEENRELKEEITAELPPYAPNSVVFANGIDNSLAKRLIISPGGCGKCWKNHEVSISDDLFYSTNFSHDEVIFGVDDYLIEGAKKIVDDGDKLKIFTTPVVDMISFDSKKIENKLKENNVDVSIYKNIGFDNSIYSLFKHYDSLNKKGSGYYGSEDGKVLLLGLNPMFFPSQKIFTSIIKFINNNKEDFIFYNAESTCAIKGIWNFSIIYEKLAQNLSEKIRVPKYLGIPYGESQCKELKKTIGMDIFLTFKNLELENTKSIGIICGITNGIKLKLYLKSMQNNLDIKKYLYLQNKEDVKNMNPIAEKYQLNILTDKEDIYNISKDHDCWIGDPTFLDIIKSKNLGGKFIDFPDPLLSGKKYYEMSLV